MEYGRAFTAGVVGGAMGVIAEFMLHVVYRAIVGAMYAPVLGARPATAGVGVRT